MKPNTPTQNPTQDLTQQLEKALAAIHELGQELVLTRDETQIARAVVKAARQALRFQVCALSLVQASDLVTVASGGYGQSLAGYHMSLDSPRGIIVAVACSGEPLYVHDVSQDPRYFVGGEFQARSELAVPLKAGERVIGVLNVESDRLDAFDAADRQQLTILADVAAVALESARAYQAEQQRAAEVTALYQLGMALVTERDPAVIAVRVFEQLDGLLPGGKTVTLSLFDLATGRLVNYAVNEGETAAPQSLALGEAGLPARVMLSGEPLRLDEPRTADAPPCAWLGVPLRVADRITGCLGVQSHHSHAFGAAEERLLAQIAAQVAPVLENARLFDETRHRLARERRLAELAHTLGGEMKLVALIPCLLPPVVELAGADAGTVAVLEPSRQVITYPFQYNLPEALIDIEAPAGSGLCGHVMTVRRPVLLDDYRTHPDAKPEWIEAGVRSMLNVPLVAGDEVMGALGLFSLKEVRPFGPEAIATAQAAGQLAAVAIQRAWLFGSERQRQRETEALRRASLALNATLDADQVLDVLLDQIDRVIPYDSANVMMIEGEQVRITHLRGPQGADAIETIKALRLPLKTPNLRRMFTTRRPHVVPNTRVDPEWVQLALTPSIRSWAGAPIVLRDKNVIGFFSLDNETPDFYTPEHAVLLAAFAAHAAIAIENARLYQAASEHALQLEEQVHERTAELQAERDRTQAILDSAAEGVIVTDRAGVIQYLNPAAEQLTGYTVAEALGQRPRLWQSGRQPASLFQKMWQTISAGQTWRGQIVTRRKDSTLYDAQVTIAPIAGPDGEPVGFVSVQSDISYLKEVDRMKDQLISNVSHELRTPLANFKLYLNLLTRGRPEKQEQYMSTLHREADRLQKLIEDLLNLSRLDTGSVQMDQVPTNLNRLVQQLVQDRDLLAAEGELTLTSDLEPDLPLALADKEMLSQVITNLMTNAMHYTPTGGRVTVRTAGAMAGERQWVTISVTDTGYGILPEEQERLFERFYRGDAAQKTGASGTGLGLTICQEIVERHAGWITVQSPANPPEEGGSTFTVWLPAV